MKTLFVGICMLLSSLCAINLNAEVQNESQTIIILLGPPGSGKGTQAVRITKDIGIPHISTGDLFRENIGKGTELGKKAKSYMDAGKLVPDEVTLDMLFDRTSRPDCVKGYLLDGFPRTIPQAEAFDKHLSKNTKLIVLNLDVKDDTIIKRTAGRYSCKQCGNIINMNTNAPKNEGKCDKCNGELYQRPDDAAPVVKERLRVYHEQTKPLIAFYEKKGLLSTVNGENAPDQVYNDLMKIYRQRIQSK